MIAACLLALLLRIAAANWTTAGVLEQRGYLGTQCTGPSQGSTHTVLDPRCENAGPDTNQTSYFKANATCFAPCYAPGQLLPCDECLLLEGNIYTRAYCNDFEVVQREFAEPRCVGNVIATRFLIPLPTPFQNHTTGIQSHCGGQSPFIALTMPCTYAAQNNYHGDPLCLATSYTTATICDLCIANIVGESSTVASCLLVNTTVITTNATTTSAPTTAPPSRGAGPHSAWLLLAAAAITGLLG